MFKFLIKVWEAYKELDVTWQTLIFTGIWTGFWKFVSKTPFYLRKIKKFLNHHVFYRFHKIQKHQFDGVRPAGCAGNCLCIFDFATEQEIQNCLRKTYRDNVKGLFEDHLIGGSKTTFFEKLSNFEKRKLHKVYVESWRRWNLKNQKDVDDFENNFSEPDERYQ